MRALSVLPTRFAARARALGVLSLLGVSGCLFPSRGVLNLTPKRDAPYVVPLCEGACTDSIALHYFGISGFRIGRGAEAVLTAPTFTLHHGGRVMFWPFYGSSQRRVTKKLRGVDLDSVSAILVGHAHYDHLVDVPYIAREFAASADIFGSSTARNMLQGVSALHGRLHDVTNSVGNTAGPGKWIYPRLGSGFRFMPLASSHAPNFRNWTIAPGEQTVERSWLPGNAHAWQMGAVYAYLIDAIDVRGGDTTVLFRIYFQDAAADSQHVDIPWLLHPSERQVDVAIMTVGNYDKAAGGPLALLCGLKPRYVVLSHWEDFLMPTRRLTGAWPVPLTDTKRLARQLSDSTCGVGNAFAAPRPGATIVFQFQGLPRAERAVGTGAASSSP